MMAHVSQGQKSKPMDKAGASFTSDFTQMGRSGSSALAWQDSILAEERRLIEKVFSIVDKDNSGSIDSNELEDMFKLFGVETHFLSAAISRIMSNVDKDHDGTISPQEFYKLLSQKFEKGDRKEDIAGVFRKMDTKKDDVLDAEELHAVALTLGEALEKQEIKDMITTFKQIYDEGVRKEKKAFKQKEKTLIDAKSVTTEGEGLKLSLDEWYCIMTQEL